jgi:two-component system chemotaxis response regulator CheY
MNGALGGKWDVGEAAQQPLADFPSAPTGMPVMNGFEAARRVLELRPAWKIVGEAGNGADGIALFHQTQPSVVIVDFQMPGMNGVEVGREIRRTDSRALLILFNLHAGKQLEELAKAAGFDAVVSKTTPFPVGGIIETLNTRTHHLEAVPNPVPELVVDAVPARAVEVVAYVPEVVPAAVTESAPASIIEAKRGLPSG